MARFRYGINRTSIRDEYRKQFPDHKIPNPALNTHIKSLVKQNVLHRDGRLYTLNPIYVVEYDQYLSITNIHDDKIVYSSMGKKNLSPDELSNDDLRNILERPRIDN